MANRAETPTSATDRNAGDDTEKSGDVEEKQELGWGDVAGWALLYTTVAIYVFWDRWVNNSYGPPRDRSSLYVYSVFAVICMSILAVPVAFEVGRRGHERVGWVLVIMAIIGFMVALVASLLA